MNYDRLQQLGGIDREVPPLPGYITKDQLQSEIVDIADFKGYFTSVSDLEEVKGADKNDWAYVSGTDEHGNLLQYLYVYKEGTGWELNSTVKQDSFTPQQWASINSGITAAILAKLTDFPDVNDYTSWDSTGTTQSGSGVLGLDGAEDNDYYEVLILTNSDIESDFRPGSLMNIPKNAVFDGETLIPLYDFHKETIKGYLKINAQRMASLSEAIQWCYVSSSNYTNDAANALVGSNLDTKDADTIKGSKKYADYVVSLRRTETVYIAAGESDDDLEIEPTIISQLEETTVDLSMFDEYLYVLCPKSRGVVITMSSIDIPMTIIGEDTIEDVEYNIFQSDNTYTGELKIALLLKF